MIKLFKVSGLSLFETPIELSLAPTERKVGLEDNVIRFSNTKRFLKSAIIYGTNNTGKSSLVNAIKLMKEIVLTGQIDSFPFLKNLPISGSNDEVHFEISFLAASKNIVYGIKFKNPSNIGEYLIVNDKLYFKKDYNGIFTDLDDNTTLSKIKDLESNKLVVTYVANEVKGVSHIPVACGYVMELFQNIIIIDNSKECLTPVTFIDFASDSQKLNLLNTLIASSPIFLNKREVLDKEAIVENRDFVRYLDINDVNDVYYRGIDLDDTDAIINNTRVMSSYQINGKPLLVPGYIFDSLGTNKFIHMAMHIINALINNQTLIIDNIDNNIHFDLLKALIELMNSEVNTDSQFIITTLDQHLTNLKSLRPDQINEITRSNPSTTPMITRRDQTTNKTDANDIDISQLIDAIKDYFI